MNKQLELVAKSYDLGVDLGRKGIDTYSNFPSSITNHPLYPLFIKMRENGGLSDSCRKEIKSFLNPLPNTNMIDLGCCLNFMFNGYDKWESNYFGVDISPKTIDLLNEYNIKNKLNGTFYCGSMHNTIYEDNSFDIGTCIGSLEYFEKEFVEKVIIEINRIIKKNGKVVIDIPNIGSPEAEICSIIEEYLGRKDMFNYSILEFEKMLSKYFLIKKKDIVGPMIQYFLICIK